MFRLQLLNHDQEQYLYGFITYTDALLLIIWNFFTSCSNIIASFPNCTFLIINIFHTLLNYNDLLF